MPQCGEYDRDRSYNAGTVFDHGMDFGSLVSEDSKNIGDPKRDETMEESCEIEVETFHNYVKSDDQSAHLDSEKPERRPRGLVYLCLFFGTLAVLVGIILALYYTLRKDEVAKRSPSTDEKSAITGEVDLVKPLSDAAQYLLDILEDHTSPSILLDPNTYQGQAFEDLVAREEVSADSTPAFQVVQQYALLSLYRSSSGDSWDVNFGWNSPQTDTCKWYGVSTCRLLENGELAVTNLDLCKYHLFCCNRFLFSFPHELSVSNSLHWLVGGHSRGNLSAWGIGGIGPIQEHLEWSHPDLRSRVSQSGSFQCPT